MKYVLVLMLCVYFSSNCMDVATKLVDEVQRVRKEKQSMQFSVLEVENENKSRVLAIADARINYLDQEYRRRCPNRIRISGRKLKMGDDVIMELVKKEMAVGLGQLNAIVHEKKLAPSGRQFFQNENSNDQEHNALLSTHDKIDLLTSHDEIEPFTEESYRLLARGCQNDLWELLFNVYLEMRQRPYLVYALHLWSRKDERIKQEHEEVFKDVMKVWTDNYANFKKNDKNCTIS